MSKITLDGRDDITVLTGHVGLDTIKRQLANGHPHVLMIASTPDNRRMFDVMDANLRSCLDTPIVIPDEWIEGFPSVEEMKDHFSTSVDKPFLDFLLDFKPKGKVPSGGYKIIVPTHAHEMSLSKNDYECVLTCTITRKWVSPKTSGMRKNKRRSDKIHRPISYPK